MADMGEEAAPTEAFPDTNPPTRLTDTLRFHPNYVLAEGRPPGDETGGRGTYRAIPWRPNHSPRVQGTAAGGGAYPAAAGGGWQRRRQSQI
jgi:hypothetical protein